MKKSLFFLAALAGLAISVVTISCNKTEVAETTPQEMPAMKPIIIVTPHEWWLTEEFPNECIEGITPHLIELCYYSLESDLDPNNTWGMQIEERRPAEMVYEDYLEQDMKPARREAYDRFLRNGFIDLNYDCPILDPALLSKIDTDYIPAGTYPIFLRDGDLVIRFKR